MDLKVKQCKDNENYLIIEKHSLFYCLCLLQIDKKTSLIEALSKINSCISNYEKKKEKKEICIEI